MFSAINRLWSRQMRTVWDVHYFVICSHLLIISAITLFILLRFWSAKSDNVQVYSMSGRGEVWMNGDPHLWLSLTGHTPLTESMYYYYYDDDNDNITVNDLKHDFKNTQEKQKYDVNIVSFDVENNIVTNHNDDADLSSPHTTASHKTLLPHLLEEYRKLYKKRMSAWNRYNSLLKSTANYNANHEKQQQHVKRVHFRLPVPVAAVMVQGAEITPAIASTHNFYGDRLISAYRFALLSGAPWLLITCYSEIECTQALHFLLTTPNIANVIFDTELLHMMNYPKNETGSVLRESLLQYNTLQEWMLRGELLDSLPCSFNTRNKFTCYNSHSEFTTSHYNSEYYYPSVYNHHHHRQEEEFWEENKFANPFAISAVHESIDVSEKLAYELLDTYEEDLLEEYEEPMEENNVDSILGHQVHNSDNDENDNHKQLNANNDNEFVVVNSFTKIHEEEEEEELEEGEEGANVFTVELVHGNSNNNKNGDGTGIDASSNNENNNNNYNNVCAQNKYDAFGRQMNKRKNEHIMKAYYPRYIIHEGIRFIQPAIVMVQKDATSTVAEPTVSILQQLIEMNAAEQHKVWRLLKKMEKNKIVKEDDEEINQRSTVKRSKDTSKHTDPIEPLSEHLLSNDKHINEKQVQAHNIDANVIVNPQNEEQLTKTEHTPVNQSQSERTVNKENKEQEEEMDDVETEEWWWWLNEEHVVFVVTSLGEQTRAKLIFTKALRDVSHDALVRLRSLIARLINERENELHVMNKNVDNTNTNVIRKSNIKHAQSAKTNKHTLLSPHNINSVKNVQADNVHLPFAPMQEYTRLFVLRPYMTGKIELFRSNTLLLPFDNKLPENMPAHCSWLARKIGVYSYYIYRNYMHVLNDFISFGSSTGGYVSDLSQLNVLTSDYEAGRISLQDIDFYEERISKAI